MNIRKPVMQRDMVEEYIYIYCSEEFAENDFTDADLRLCTVYTVHTLSLYNSDCEVNS